MPNGYRLKEYVGIKGKTLKWLAEEIGMSVSALSEKVNGKSQFTVLEVSSIQEVLGLSDSERNEIFFYRHNSDKKSTEVK